MPTDTRTRVLITGASGDSAQGVIRALRGADRAYFIAAVCINERNPGFLMSDVNALAPPYSEESEYIDFLIEFIRRHTIDVLIPTIDGELPLISRRSEEIVRRSGAKVIVGEHDSVQICYDKLVTSRFLDELSVAQPILLSGGFDEIRRHIQDGNRVIMKPREGGGSRGIRILGDADLLSDRWMRDDCIYQHYERYEREYSSVALKDGKDVAAIAVLERELSGGRTVWSRRVKVSRYENLIHTVAAGLDLPYMNIQFGWQGSQLQVFDINPRFSGSTAVFSLVFNGPDLLVQKAVSGRMPKFKCSDRYFESMRYLADIVVDRAPHD